MNNNVNQNTDCSTCGKCADTEETQKQIQQETSKRAKLSNVDANGNPLYTFLIYSENTPGLLSQITAVYTRRQVNIESLNVCASSTPGVHKFTVTSYCTEEMAKMLTKQMEKRIEVLRASYYTDDEIFILETSLIKISTPRMLEEKNVGRIVRMHNAHIVEVNPTYATVEKTGITADILSLYDNLNQLGVVLQFVRSGRIAITKSRVEHLDEYLAERERERQNEL
jgi:acetolactate synthase-1/3 small subunit